MVCSSETGCVKRTLYGTVTGPVRWHRLSAVPVRERFWQYSQASPDYSADWPAAAAFWFRNGFDTCDVTLNVFQTCGHFPAGQCLRRTQVEDSFLELKAHPRSWSGVLSCKFFWRSSACILSTSPVGPLNGVTNDVSCGSSLKSFLYSGPNLL